MDIVFLAGVATMWALTVLMVMGFERLDQPNKGQS